MFVSLFNPVFFLEMKPKNLLKIAALLAAVFLAACGGGGDNKDQSGNPSADSNSPVVELSGAAPVANAGVNQNVVIGATVTLDGAASTLGAEAVSGALKYAWTLTSKPAGSAAGLSSGHVVRPTFLADMPGVYTASLIVNDGKASSEPALVTITVANESAAPVANAGVSREVATGSRVSLDGSASSDSNGDLLAYRWTLTSVPAGSAAELQGADTAKPSFIPERDGQYVASLIVNDGQIDSAPVTVTVTATSGNVAPTANAGANQYVQPQTSVTLDGSASSDGNGDPLTYRWSMTSKPEGSSASLSSSTAVYPTFVADKEGDYVVSLVVNDGTVDSEPVAVTVNASTSSLTLYSFNWPYEKLESLPYSGKPVYEVSTALSSTGRTVDFTVGRFKLVATGQNYTITNLVAEKPSNSNIQLVFTGLANNQVIASGTSVVFQLQGSYTGEFNSAIRYRFTIKETGQTFVLDVPKGRFF